MAELVVVMALIALIVPLAGAVLRSTAQTQAGVQSMTTGTATSQAVVASVEAGIRNAAGHWHAPVDSQGNELLVARVRNARFADPGWSCQAWFYQAADEVLYTRKVSAPPPADWILPPNDDALSTSWTPLAERVRTAPGAGAVFAPDDSGRGVDLAFSVAAAGPSTTSAARTITISTTIVRRPQESTGVEPCAIYAP